ncbi:MAG: hypothetical protein R3Y46_03310 [Opitutales bacterium]
MPIYTYEVIDTKEVFEVEQSINSKPIEFHPENGLKVRRIYSNVNINSRYTKSKENKLSDVSNIKKAGFKVLQKDKATGNYHAL